MLNAGVTTRVSDWVAVCGVGEVLSVALTVNVDDPPVAGVPEILPAALRLRPVGREPKASDQV